MDVTKEDAVKAALTEIKSYVANKGLFALINNAGVLRGELLDTMSMEDWTFQVSGDCRACCS
jgi:NADP-dependent 3-hydroxy acid dehydrogenase YdfG